ncbi:MAG: response regulator, partial [Polyangiaceae bacterium]|nr:response regulator [Polyangiaceae bacterium]
EHDVTTAASASCALALFRAGRRFDVVLCDLMMPQVTGMDLHAALMQLDAAQASRVVFMTGGAFTPSARAFLDAVPNPRVEKPFDVQGLRAMIGLLVAES